MQRTSICLIAAAAAVALASPAAAVVTITGIPDTGLATFTTTTADAFDVNQGATITAVNGGTIFPATNALGGVTPNTGEPNNLVFNTFGTQGFTFRTAAPVQIGGFNLYLADDGDGPIASRNYSSITVRGSTDGITFVDLDTAVIPGTSYTAVYGSRIIRLSSTLAAPVTYQFFQFEGIQRQTGSFPGGRVLELDAVAANVTPGAVPEPASWAMMIAGFGLVGGAMRSRRREVRFAA